MNTSTIIVKKKAVYGRDLIYPVCEASKVFARLTGKKTLTPSQLQLIKSLGIAIQSQQDEF